MGRGACAGRRDARHTPGALGGRRPGRRQGPAGRRRGEAAGEQRGLQDGLLCSGAGWRTELGRLLVGTTVLAEVKHAVRPAWIARVPWPLCRVELACLGYREELGDGILRAARLPATGGLLGCRCERDAVRGHTEVRLCTRNGRSARLSSAPACSVQGCGGAEASTPGDKQSHPEV